MGSASIVAWLVVGVGCGRIGFDGAGDAKRDDSNGTGDAPLALSCSGLTTTCGPSGASPCCGSSLVAGGMFYRGYDVGPDDAFPNMTNPATVSDFRLDTYEVTVGRFRQFVNAGMGTQASPPLTGAGARTLNGATGQGGWDPSFNANLLTDTPTLVANLSCDPTYQTWTDTPGANEDLPIGCITWFEAMAFCVWDGGFLPTEAEWSYAATGGNEQRAYPWSSPPSSLTIDCSYANYYNANIGEACVNPPNGTFNRVGSESPTGDGKWGQADLIGNVYERVLDWYATTYGNPCTDCADLTATLERVILSSTMTDDDPDVRIAFRQKTAPATRTAFIGVRCARAP